MSTTEPILVLGHRNPDTDAIASAMGFAWLLNQTRDADYQAGRLGAPNAQTTFALERFGVEAPALISDVRSRVVDSTEKLPYLTDGQTLIEACQLVAKGGRPAALLDADMNPIGLLTSAGLFGALAGALSSASLAALETEFNRPARSAVDSKTTILREDEYTSDILQQVLRADSDEFLVVDSAGNYGGVCRKSALLSPSHRSVVLVDHNELSQSVAGLEEAEIVGILDHHRLSSPPTAVPIPIQIEPVGSCSTLVAEQGFKAEQMFPSGIAGMLLCGILSDTLIFRSPTSTDRERAAALRLAVQANLAPETASESEIYAAIEQLGDALLSAGAGFGSRPAEEIIGTDVKYFEVGAATVGIGQVEVTNFNELATRLQDLREGMQKLAESENLTMAVLMITDVVRGDTRLIVVGPERLIAALPFPRLEDGTLDAPGVVSRKKQLLPPVLEALAQA